MSHLQTESTHNADELVQYRSLSTTAVLALILGLCSPLAFVGVLGYAVPFMAIALALVALARIHSAGNSITGRPLALAAIALAVIFTTAAVVRVTVRDTLAVRQASAAGARWLNLVSTEQTDAALELMTADALLKLQPPNPRRDEQPPAFDRPKAVALLGEAPLAHALKPAKSDTAASIQVFNQQFFWGERDAQVGCMFRATGAQADPVEGSVVLSRKQTPEGGLAWLINSWTLTNPKSSDPHAGHQH